MFLNALNDRIINQFNLQYQGNALTNNSQYQSKNLAIYFDTNTFWNLDIEMSNDVFLDLQRWANMAGANIFIPKMVFEERVHQITKSALDEIEKMRESNQKLSGYLRQEPTVYEEPNNVEERVRETITETLNKANVKIISSLKNIPFDTIVKMALKRTAPFKQVKKGVTGFNDTVILFTIIQHMKENTISNAILISSDGDFDKNDVYKRFKDNGLKILVLATITEASETLKTTIDKIEKAEIEKRSEEVKTFLNSRFNEISDFVLKRAKVLKKQFIVGGGLMRALAKESGIIQEVLAIRPKAIEGVFFDDNVSSKKINEKEVKPVTFSVSIDIDVMVRENRFLLEAPVLLSSLEGERDVERITTENFEEKRTITRSVTVEAEITKVEEHYTDLTLFRVMTYY